MANHLDLEEQEQIDQLKHFWNTWGTLISSAALVIALGLAGWNGYQFWQNRQAGQAAALLDAVDVAAASGDMGRLEQAFSDMRSKFGGTAQAGLAGLTVGKAASSAGNSALAKSALTWVTESAKDDGHKAIARLRLSALLMEEKAYDEALKQLSVPFAAEYAAVVADRKGDVLIADTDNHCIRKLSLKSGTIELIAGRGTGMLPGSATTISLNQPHGVTVKPGSDLIYIADSNNNRIVKLTATGK